MQLFKNYQTSINDAGHLLKQAESMSTITKLEIRIIFLGGWTELSSRVFSVLPCASLSHVPCLHFSFGHETGSDLAGTAYSAGQEQTQPVGSCREHGEEINLCGCKPLRCGEFVTINWPALTHTYILSPYWAPTNIYLTQCFLSFSDVNFLLLLCLVTWWIIIE